MVKKLVKWYKLIFGKNLFEFIRYYIQQLNISHHLLYLIDPNRFEAHYVQINVNKSLKFLPL